MVDRRLRCGSWWPLPPGRHPCAISSPERGLTCSLASHRQNTATLPWVDYKTWALCLSSSLSRLPSKLACWLGWSWPPCWAGKAGSPPAKGPLGTETLRPSVLREQHSACNQVSLEAEPFPVQTSDGHVAQGSPWWQPVMEAEAEGPAESTFLTHRNYEVIGCATLDPWAVVTWYTAIDNTRSCMCIHNLSIFYSHHGQKWLGKSYILCVKENRGW